MATGFHPIAKSYNPPDAAIIVDHMVMDFELKLLSSFVFDDNVFVTAASGLPGLLQGTGRVQWPRGIETGFTWGPSTVIYTLAGAVIEALCKAWHVPIEKVAAVNNLARESEVNIGKARKKKISALAIRVVKPQA